MSTRPLTLRRGKPKPRWSKKGGPLKGGVVTKAALPAEIDGLPGSSAMVGVGPPLFCRPAGSSSGVVLNRLPLPAVMVGVVLKRLLEAELRVPETSALAGAVLRATMLLSTVAGPETARPPP